MKKTHVLACVFVVVLWLVFGGCNAREEDKAYNSIAEPFEQYIPTDSESIYYVDTYVIYSSTSTVRINENMPEFTIIYKVNYYFIEEQEVCPERRLVTILIKDENENEIQELSDLIQFRNFNFPPTFEDYNFDGYLDMRMIVRQEGLGTRDSLELFWLWCVDSFEFVINNQLTQIASPLFRANQETRQIETTYLINSVAHRTLFYEFHNGEFVLVSYQFTCFNCNNLVECEWCAD